MAEAADRPTLPTHGAAKLPSVTVDDYNLELEDADGFIGDRARRDAFREALDDWRKRHKATAGEDPLWRFRRPSGAPHRAHRLRLPRCIRPGVRRLLPI